MREADEFGLLAERYVGPLVLKPDRARGLEARYADANEFVEEDAAVRVASAFGHELKLASPEPLRVRYHNTTGISATNYSRSRSSTFSMRFCVRRAVSFQPLSTSGWTARRTSAMTISST
jgi:hypothetical protein